MHPYHQARIRIVQSPANRWVKALRAAVRRPPSLGERGAMIALEGPHLVAEALGSRLTPAAIFLRQGAEDGALAAVARPLNALLGKSHPGQSEGSAFFSGAEAPARTELLALPEALFAALLPTEAPQPIAALLPAPERKLAACADPLVLVLASVQDPGNVGALLRSAEAFGAAAAVLLAGTATPWSAKALRASAGSALRVPLLPARDAGAAAELLRGRGIRSWAAVPAGGEPPSAFTGPTALWIGNEGAGLSAAELSACDARVSLPMPGPVESLNAAVAGSLLLYEAARRRS